jgi:hypothetical protein
MLKKILCFLIFANISFAKNIALFWGGGGEPSSKDSTIFDSDFRAFVPGLLAKGWEVRPLFGRGHAKTENLVSQFDPQGLNREFNSKSVYEEIQKLMLEIKNLTQVLLIVSSHGHEPQKDQKSHRVSATDPRIQNTVNLNEIIELRDLLEEHRIPFAVIDLSCYSGATLDLATQNTCVISSSSSQEFSYSQFASALAREMLKGSHFEQSFLKARQQFDDFSSPEISTPENSIIKFQLAEMGLNQFPHKNYLYCSSCEIHTRLLKLYQIDLENWKPLFNEAQSESFVTQMLRDREEAQLGLKQYASMVIKFEEMEAIKSKSLIRHFFTERQLYRHLYQQIQTGESHPCRNWKL